METTNTKRQHLLDVIRAEAHAVALNEYAATGRSAAALDIEACPTVARLIADYPSAAKLLGSYDDVFARGAAARAAEEGFAAGEAAARAQDEEPRFFVRSSPTGARTISARGTLPDAHFHILGCIGAPEPWASRGPSAEYDAASLRAGTPGLSVVGEEEIPIGAVLVAVVVAASNYPLRGGYLARAQLVAFACWLLAHGAALDTAAVYAEVRRLGGAGRNEEAGRVIADIVRKD